MANPFEGFAYSHCNGLAPVRPVDSPTVRACTPPTSSSDLVTAQHIKRARRQPSQPPASPIATSQQKAALTAPVPPDDAAVIDRRPAAASKRPNGPAKKRKAYASLTGPPKGLGPKLGTSPLRLILIGHNPSEHAFHTGHFYSNPSNRMWPILISTGIAPPGTTGPEADDSMPETVGVGFIDVGSGQPGTDSSLFTSEDFLNWRGAFYDRLKQHVAAASQAVGCTCGKCGAPKFVAFTGKRQFLELLNIDAAGQLRRGKNKVSSVQLGKQPPDMLPPGWPLPVDRSEVWVMTSTSGAAPMTKADRERPYQQLAERLAEVPWPRSDIVVSCCNWSGSILQGNSMDQAGSTSPSMQAWQCRSSSQQTPVDPVITAAADASPHSSATQTESVQTCKPFCRLQ